MQSLFSHFSFLFCLLSFFLFPHVILLLLVDTWTNYPSNSFLGAGKCKILSHTRYSEFLIQKEWKNSLELWFKNYYSLSVRCWYDGWLGYFCWDLFGLFFFFKEQGFSYVFCRFSAGLKLRTEFRRERESVATLNLGGHNRLAPNMELGWLNLMGIPLR